MTLLGAPVQLRRSWLWLFPLAALAGWAQGGVALAVFVLLVPTTVLVHELGHLLVARRLGVAATRVELGLWEGRVWLGPARTRRDRAAILVAGPAAHALWAALWLAASLAGGWDPSSGSVAATLRAGALLALLWALGNLRPIGQSDGAQLLALALSADPTGRWRAGVVALGAVVLFVCGAALLLATPLWFVGGAFLAAAALAAVGAGSIWPRP